MLSNKAKILIGVSLATAIIAIALLLTLSQTPVEKPISVKGKPTIVSETALFNKECTTNDFKLGEYYLAGLCKKPGIVASLSEAMDGEIEVKGIAKNIEVTLPSETNPAVMVAKTVQVIEVEEVMPPEIIMIATDTTRYKQGEKITIHLKHYLKNSVFSHFKTEKPVCAIKSIETKKQEWEKLASWAQPADCDSIELKETKAFHSSGDYSTFEWTQNLEPGQYRLKIAYKLAGKENFKETASNEFTVLKPETTPYTTTAKCIVGLDRGGSDWPDINSFDFSKVAIVHFDWNHYNSFSVEKIEIDYGLTNPYWGEWWGIEEKWGGKGKDVLTVKFLSPEGKIVETATYGDPRYSVAISDPSPGVQGRFNAYFAPEGERYFFFKLKPEIIGSIEIFEREKLPSPPFAEGEAFEGFKPGELLIKIDLRPCMKKFCEQIASVYEMGWGKKDPFCQDNYEGTEYLEPPAIQGIVSDHTGNPLKKTTATINFSEKLGEVQKFGMVFVGDNGKYAIDSFNDGTKLREGLYTIEISPFDPNLKDTFIEVKLKKDEIKTVDVRLKQCGSISGKVVDQHGNPIIEAWVYEADRFEPPHNHVCDPASVPGCEAGSFLIKNFEAGTRKIGAEVKIGEGKIGEGQYVQLPPQTVQIELGKTININFVYNK